MAQGGQGFQNLLSTVTFLANQQNRNEQASLERKSTLENIQWQAGATADLQKEIFGRSRTARLEDEATDIRQAEDIIRSLTSAAIDRNISDGIDPSKLMVLYDMRDNPGPYAPFASELVPEILTSADLTLEDAQREHRDDLLFQQMMPFLNEQTIEYVHSISALGLASELGFDISDLTVIQQLERDVALGITVNGLIMQQINAGVSFEQLKENLLEQYDIEITETQYNNMKALAAAEMKRALYTGDLRSFGGGGGGGGGGGVQSPLTAEELAYLKANPDIAGIFMEIKGSAFMLSEDEDDALNQAIGMFRAQRVQDESSPSLIPEAELGGRELDISVDWSDRISEAYTRSVQAGYSTDEWRNVLQSMDLNTQTISAWMEHWKERLEIFSRESDSWDYIVSSNLDE